jgi:transcription elongation factor Elf1
LTATENTLFICPQCDKAALSIHRKTYDGKTIIFCIVCHLSADFTPSKEAIYDSQLTYKEFITGYKNNNKKENLLIP